MKTIILLAIFMNGETEIQKMMPGDDCDEILQTFRAENVGNLISSNCREVYTGIKYSIYMSR